MSDAADARSLLQRLPDPRLGTRATTEPGIGGRFRVRNDEFLVEELPLFEPSGSGDHLYLRIQKDGISHRDMIGRLQRAFGVDEEDVGYAGMKDRRAITQQTVSIHTPLDTASVLDDTGLLVVWGARHEHKLRRGQLQGNRFSIRIRDIDPLKAPRCWRILQQLEAKGLPNAYMSQRFGYRVTNHRLGAAWSENRWRDLLDEWLGTGGSVFPPSEASVRRDYDEGRYQQALEASGREWWAERAALRALSEGASPARACSAVPKAIRELWLDAAQATIFNRVLARRLREGELDRLVPGDIGWNHDVSRWFRLDTVAVDDAEMAERLERIEVSATGPLHGRRMPKPGPAIEQRETEAAIEAGIDPAAYVEAGGARRGSRRPFRVPLRNAAIESGTDERGGFLRVAFDLPRGAYATGVLSEIMGVDAVEDRGWLTPTPSDEPQKTSEAD